MPDPLKVWLVKRVQEADYDEHEGFVVVESTEGWARQRAYLASSDYENHRERVFLDPKQATCEEIGVCTVALAGVVLASFRAG